MRPFVEGVLTQNVYENALWFSDKIGSTAAY